MTNFTYFILFPSFFILLWQGLTYPFKKPSSNEKIISYYFPALGMASLIFSLIVATSSLKSDIDLLGLAPLKFDSLRGWIFFFTNILYVVVADFSMTYLSKDKGFFKFFLNYHIFWLGLFFFIFGNNALVLFAGWELIGVSSIFLIGYYSDRPNPVLNSLYVVSFYKVADIILITSLLLFQHSEILALHHSYIPFLYFGIIFAGLIKSGSFPFTSWLPRAMEGPTTSSAIFYGALSINTGVLLIVFHIEEILAIPSATIFLGVSGVLTVIYSSLQSRVQSSAKNLLVYSSSQQIGFVLIELALGWQTIALFHLFGNSFHKVYYFIKTPSILSTFHEMVGENGKPFGTSGLYFQKLIPKKIRLFLYYQNLHHFHLNSFYDKLAHLSLKVSYFAERLFYPLINKGNKVSLWSLMWVIYYLLLSYFINSDAIEIHKEYFDIIPFFIMLVSISMIHQKSTNAFVALMMIYKILESFILHGVHGDEPLKIVGNAILFFFVLLILIYGRRKYLFKVLKKIIDPLLIFLMLYFTNFPFLLQSLVNEHIIEAFLEQGMIMDLGFYCLANTFLNIGLYRFIFNRVYLEKRERSL